MGVPQQRPLFRQEAVEFQQQNRQWGRVVPLQPLPTRILVWVVIAAAAAIVAFLFVAQYARKETVKGYLTPVAGTARIFAPTRGTVSAVHVRQGEHVAEGQPLFAVSIEQIAADGQDVNAVVLASLERQRDHLTRQMAAEAQRAGTERDRLAAQIAGLDAEIGFIAAQIGLQRERIGVVERLVASGAQLATRGLVSEVEQRRREEQLLEQRLSLSTLLQQRIARESQRTEAHYQLEQLPVATAEKLQALRNELAATEQRMAEVDGRRAYVVRAPVAGRVSALQAGVGQVADPARLQLQIIPGEATLQAELFIPARAIGFVQPGQEVRILYDAFPYQHFGTYRGRVLRVSETILTAADVTAPVVPAEPAYRATVALERPDIDAYGRRIALQPDMLLRADIILERRTLVDWILDPLRSARVSG